MRSKIKKSKEKIIIKKEQDINFLFKKIEDLIFKKGKKIFVLAGPSSSGKTYLSEKIKEYLENKGLSVLLLSLDNFYKKHSMIYSIIYGSFDHIRLFDYIYLNKCLKNLTTYGYCYLPIYSFVEKDRVDYKRVEKADIILIEGLYPFKLINKKFLNRKDVSKIFITAEEDELLIRRIIRDPERTKEPLNVIIENLTSVFPFWKLFGENQKEFADLIILNNYPVLNNYKKEIKNITARELNNLKKEYKYKVYIAYDYIYHNKKQIKVREYYPYKSDLISHYSFIVDEKNNYYEISLRTPGKLSKLHLLLQNLGFKFKGVDKKLILIFKEDEKPIYEVEIKKEKGKYKSLKFKSLQ